MLAGADSGDKLAANLFDTATGVREANIRSHAAPVNGVALNQAGDRVAISGWSVVPANGGLREIRSELFVVAARGGDELFRPTLPPSHIIGSPALSPDGRRLACAVRAVTLTGGTMTRDPTVAIYVWDLAGGLPRIMDGRFDGGVICVVFSPDGSQVAATSVDETVRLWDVDTGRLVFAPVKESRASTGLAFSPDGRRLASAATDGLVRLWDATRGERLLTLRGLGPPGSGHYGYTARVAFSSDGTRLAANDWDGTVTIWDAASVGSSGQP